MGKRVYFIVTSIIGILLSIDFIDHIDSVIKSIKDVSDMFPGELQNRINALVNNSGRLFFIIMALLGILIFSYFIYLAIKNRIMKKKSSVMALSVALIFLASTTLGELIAIANIVLLWVSKPNGPDEEADKIDKMPNLKREEVDSKKIVMAIILIGTYFALIIGSKIIPIGNGLVRSILIYGFLIGLSIYVFKDLYKVCFKEFIKHFKAYKDNLIGKIGIFYLIYLVVALMSFVLYKKGISANQEGLEKLPLYFVGPLAIIYAPIVEEAVFRGCIRRFIKNDTIFIIISALSFGLLHTITSEASLVAALIAGLPYIAMGGFFAYLYVKTNNICVNMSMHAFQNLLSFIVMIFMYS